MGGMKFYRMKLLLTWSWKNLCDEQSGGETPKSHKSIEDMDRDIWVRYRRPSSTTCHHMNETRLCGNMPPRVHIPKSYSEF